MKVLTLGCSFTAGDELDDFNLAWPNILANMSGLSVTNLAQFASSNTKMVRRAVENINTFDAFIIAWSHYARTEFADDQGVYDVWPARQTPEFKQSPHRYELIKYLTAYNNDNYYYRQYLIDIILLQNLFKQHNKKYIMLNSFGNDSKQAGRNQDLVNQIETEFYLGWPNDTMMEWTYGSPVGANGHFLEQGHEIVAGKIYEHIRHLSWVS